MLKRLLFILAGYALATPAGAQDQSSEQTAVAPRPNAAALFGARESVLHADISPSGRRIAYLAAGPAASTLLFVQGLDAGAQPRLVIASNGAPERLRWCTFVTDERLICRVTLVRQRPGDRALIPFSRLIVVEETGQTRPLGERASFYDSRVRQFDGSILDWLAGADGSILMAREYIQESDRTGTRLGRVADGLGIDRIDTATMRVTPVEGANRIADGFITDGRGNVRIMSSTPLRGSTGQLSERTQFFYRIRGSSEWQSLGFWGDRAGMLPVAIDAERDAAYVLKRLEGRLALYRVALDGSMTEQLVYANPRVDVDAVVRLGRAGQVIGVTFAEEQRRAIYFDPDFQRLANALARALPNLPLIDFVSVSTDGAKLLIHAGADNDPGRYYVYDRETRALTEIVLVRPELEAVPLAAVRSVTYPAADGTQIPAYLTLPPGLRDARGLPSVLLPHGGPQARDEWGFDWLAQYLAHIGYAVLQPNFRGSGGFGDQWLAQNGFQGWQTSIGDVLAGARWLAAQGIADPGRMAIVGWSYGGYAALQAGVVDPELFRAIVAIAPVTDLQQLKDDQQAYTDARNAVRFIGTGPHIREGSPLQNAAAIHAPVLLFHGDMDLNVSAIHARRMNQQLQTLGRRSQLRLFEGLNHDLADSAVRSEMLARIGEFLNEATAPR